MFSFVVLALAAASASAHSISHVRRHHVPRSQPPAGWSISHLEAYDVYHTRYQVGLRFFASSSRHLIIVQAIGCGNKHNTSFFDLCCHPLLVRDGNGQKEPPRVLCCRRYCRLSRHRPCKDLCKDNGHHCKDPPAKTTAAPAAPAKTTAAQDDGDEDCDDEDDDNDTCYDEDDGEDCDDEDESTTHVAPTSTKVAPTTSSSHAAGPPTTSTHITPTTSSTHTTPKETTTAKAATTHTTPKSTPVPTTSASTGGKSSSGSFILGGFGTWFMQNGVAGACGKVHKDSDFVVALETKTYAKGINCGRTVQLCDVSNNKCVNGLVADECPTCTNAQSVDMSQGMFKELAALSVGEFKIQWKFVD
ncbi:Barwin-like endoglucanase [Mycena venus]|uniref:Barwin-like endoglucanase n=1 Tax=Mycena venus TaxID=2733690 RepID=A0A8H6XBY1_9AGAR|nr:Barwin-like endoglucanase [Mycena venus]